MQGSTGSRVTLLLGAALLALAAGCGTTVGSTTVGASGAPAAAGNGLAAPSTATSRPGTVTGGGTSGALTRGTTATSQGNGTGPATGFGPPSPGPGGSGTRAPITVGITFINNQQASSALGANDPRTNSVKTVVEAYVRAINATGGVAGRRLKTVEYEWHSGDGSWSTAAAAACASLTQDHHVDVVLDEAFGTIGGFRECIQRAGIFDVTNADEGDNVSSSQAPLHANPVGMTFDRMYGAVLQQEVASGYLGKHNQLGIMVEGCAEDVRAYTRTLVPMIRQLGLAAPKESQFNCVDSVDGGASEGSAAISNAILRFRQPPVVDRVMFVSGQESAALLLFGAQASSQNYHPGYLLSSNAQAHLFTGEQPFPSDQVPQLHGVGNSPYGDVNDAKPIAVDTQCLRLLKTAGITASNYDDVGQALFTCGPFLLLRAALERTGGNSSPRALEQGIASLGGTFAAPGVVQGGSRFTSTQHDGGDLIRVFAYQGACACIRYTSAPAHAPTSNSG